MSDTNYNRASDVLFHVSRATDKIRQAMSDEQRSVPPVEEKRTWKQRIVNFRHSQWKAPYRLLYKGFGIVIWKWSACFMPIFSFHLGRWSIGWDIFRRGCGVRVDLSPVIFFRLCLKGKIDWWYKGGLFDVTLFQKWNFKY